MTFRPHSETDKILANWPDLNTPKFHHWIHRERERERERQKWQSQGIKVPTFSLPARSTRYSLPLSFFCVSMFSCLTLMRNTEWLREECSFMSTTNKTTLQLFMKTHLRPTQSVNCRMESVTQNRCPHHKSSQTGWYLIYLPQMDERMSWPWWLVMNETSYFELQPIAE